jgi:hypothetical protein
MRQVIKSLIVFTIIFIILMFSAFARPPEGADPSLAPFFHGLMQPGGSVSCCSEADCRAVVYKITSRGYQAYITPEEFATAQTSKWVEIPGDKILSPRPNPTGAAILCWTPALGVLCFLPTYQG